MTVLCLKMIPKNSAPTSVTGMDVAFVSGPRTVMVALPWYLVTTISHWLAAMELRVPGCSVCARQIHSTKGESDSLSSTLKIIVLPRLGWSLQFQFALNPSRGWNGLVEMEETCWIILCLDLNQALIVGSVVSICPVLEVWVDEVLEHPLRSPRMHR